MARTNVLQPKPKKLTHEGAVAYQHPKKIQELQRAVLSNMLWENEYYESGVAIADRIGKLCSEVKPEQLAELAIKARKKMHLRHISLLLLVYLLKHGKGYMVGRTIGEVVSRADEIAELISMYWKINGKTDKSKKFPKQLRMGLGIAFNKFDEYAFAKYNRDGEVKLRDALFLVYPKGKDKKQSDLFNKIAKNELKVPDTWEVKLSAGQNKKETFEKLIKDEELGYLATLRNIRNMVDAGVDRDLLDSYIIARKGAGQVFPFRYVAAARACPQMEPVLDQALIASLADLPQCSGTTAIMVDVSGSMNQALSGKSDMTRMTAAATLAAIFPGRTRVFSFSDNLVEVPPRKGMAGVDAIIKSQTHNGTWCGKACQSVYDNVKCDRLIVITDEQSHDTIPVPPKTIKGYMINVASAKNGVGYGPWTHLDGFSENVIRWIVEHEKEEE